MVDDISSDRLRDSVFHVKHFLAISAYCELLKAYNSHTNIYSASAYDRLPFHIQDSLNMAFIIHTLSKGMSSKVMDMGSGSGLPAVPIAVSLPEYSVVAVESKSRKCRFLEEAKREFDLARFHVECSNVREYIYHRQPEVSFITAKAFVSPVDILDIVGKLKKWKWVIIPVSEKQSEIFGEAFEVVVLEVDRERFFYLVKEK